MATNKAAFNALVSSPFILTEENAIMVLIKAGFITADELTEPERYAEGARNWVRYHSAPGCADAKEIFDKASGWCTEGWETVMDGEKIVHYPNKIKNIFQALVILAEEAGEL